MITGGIQEQPCHQLSPGLPGADEVGLLPASSGGGLTASQPKRQRLSQNEGEGAAGVAPLVFKLTPAK